MKKRILCIILAVCVILSALPLSVFAITEYGIWIAGTQITSENTWSREGWGYDANTNTLTLRDGYSMATKGERVNGNDEKPGRFAIIYVEGAKDLTINIAGAVQLGDSSFSSEASTPKYNESYSGIYAPDANITVTGEGTLTIVTHDTAIFAKNLTVAMSASAQRSVLCESYGACVIAKENIVVNDNSRLEAFANHVWPQINAVTAGDNLTVRGANAEVCGIATLQDKSQKGYTPYIPPYMNMIFSMGVAAGIGVGKCISVDGGTVSGTLRKPKAYDAYEHVNTFGIEMKKLVMTNGATVNAFNDNPTLREMNENGLSIRSVQESDGIWFDGECLLRTGVKNCRFSDTWEYKTMVCAVPFHVSPGLNVRKASSSEYSDYQAYAEYHGEKLDKIYIKKTNYYGYWSYYSDFGETTTRFIWSDGLKLNDVYNVVYGTDKPLDVVLLSGELELDINLDEGREFPKITVVGGATLKLKMDSGKKYILTNTIDLKAGNLELPNGAIARGIDVTGSGKVIIKSGNFSGTLGNNVTLQISGGSADFNDNGKAIDDNGNSVRKYTYVAEGVNGDEFVGTAYTRQPPYDTYYGYGSSGVFHEGNKLYLWLKAKDSIYGVNTRKKNADGTYEKDNTFYTLQYGTNILAHRIPFAPIKLKYFVIKEGDGVTLSVMTGTPSDLQEKDILVEWYLVNGENETMMTRTNNVHLNQSAVAIRNGHHYRAKVNYGGWDGDLSISYTYDAYIFIDDPKFISPDKFTLGQKARFEVTNNTPASDAAVWLNYSWEVSKDGGKTFTAIEGETSSVYEPVVDVSMLGWQIRCKTWVTTGDSQSTEPTVFGPVTIDFSERPPRIITHPKDGACEAPEQSRPAKPGEITIVIERQYIFNVTASGSDIKYQWQISSDNGRTFIDIPGETTDNAGLKVNKENDGKLVRCIVSNEYGSAVSNAARLTVYYQPRFADTISDTTVNVGRKAEFKLTLEQGKPYGIEAIWQVSKDGGNTFTDVTQADGTFTLDSEIVNGEEVWSTSFTTCRLNKNHNGYKYRCVARNAQNETYVGTWRSNEATITVTGTCENDSHDFDSGTVITEPTCTEAGLKRYQCNNCTYYKDENLDAAGHDYAPATCTEPETCKICRATYGNPLGHSFSGYEKDGEKHWQKCSVCRFETEKETHTYVWESGNGQYWKKCTVCKTVTAVSDIPRVFIKGADQICCSKDYEFSFVLPDGSTEITAGCRFTGNDTKVTVTKENGEFRAKVNASNLEIGTMTVYVSATLEDGFIITAKKEVTVRNHSGGEATCTEKAICDFCGNEYGEFDSDVHTGETVWDFDSLVHWKKYDCCGKEASIKLAHQWQKDECTECGYKCRHSGGEATCTKKAICDICGSEYGEIDPNNHGKLTHIEEVKATTDKEGNIEYWHCEECGTSFKDSDGKERADNTVVPKISKSESSGDESLAVVLLILLLAGGLLAAVLYRKREY